MVKSVETFICPYCDEEYNDYDDANYCARECIAATADDPIEKHKYQCEICGEQNRNREYLITHETKHKENEDHEWQLYLEEKQRERLEIAAQHPNQLKLYPINQ